ncbi:related to NUG1 - Nuclear GTPase (involved in Ribosome biogenesis) [Melanopsichium pennsylvanicum]|uniref:Related to NUG1 - Nuclear GTPase (Involved in Ribosome biogenesis) n=2 Tax=Melanopsichium pennsylvanicum TaxID=63383 RepID=A0AAJ4XN26_9BASI|nr:related to NUG1-Nuclear GTPase (involved in Ribosome biogenesis) [Melanopsichium pennsylvanicum 4]SNX84806.1 related to NUG1 - Nuclear GTPase (involved in Ribosome biogenesis) [Melanopsichium pennsylvanicum]
MGRQHRKEDRPVRKKSKLSASQSHISSSSGSSNGVGKQSSNAGFVFNKNAFTSLVNKGKQRQLQHVQAQASAAQRRAGAAPSQAMGTDVHEIDETSAVARARLRQEIAGAAATSNSHLYQDDKVEPDEHTAFFAQSAPQLDPTLTGRRDSSIKAYMRELRKVVDNADVLLQVLDARDPLGCRSLETERMLLRAGKKIVLILNKIDLVPKSNVEAWLKYLRHDFPTLAFKASTQSQRNNLSQGANAINYSKPSSSSSSSSASDVIAGGSEAIGAGALLQLIKNYSRSLNMKTSIAVGVFGAPNVGKSSLINSLKRSRVCSVASTPGHTKVVQSVMLDKSVRLLDCPGIVFSDESVSGAASLGLSAEEIQIRRQSALLRNVVKVELVQDPIIPVEAIMARVEAQHLMQVYGLEWYQQGDAQDFLMRVAVNRGRMARGGKIDIEGTARSVLHDWNVGKIKYYTHPPALHRSAILSVDEPRIVGDALTKSIGGDSVAEGEGGGEQNGVDKRLEQSSKILTGFSEAFDLAALLGEADAEVFGGGTGQSNAPLPEAPVPRLAPLVEEKREQEIEDDHIAALVASTCPPPVADADTSLHSNLGKRSRLSDSESSSDDDDNDDLNSDRKDSRFAPPSSRRPNIPVPGLDPQDDDVSETEDTPVGTAARSNFTFASPSTLTTNVNSWNDKLAAKATACKRVAELSLAFSPEELAQMAPTTGAARRKLKKMKKRADKAGAGLVGKFEGQKLGEEEMAMARNGEAGGIVQGSGKGMGGGMFGNVGLNKMQNKNNQSNNGGVPKKTGSMFDILMEGQEMDDSDQEDEEKQKSKDEVTVASAGTAVTADDYEEEL